MRTWVKALLSAAGRASAQRQPTGAARVPEIFVDARRWSILLVVAAALGQAAAAGLAAFATRSVFAHLHSGASEPPMGAVALLVAAGLMLAAARIAGRAVAERLGLDYAAELRARLFQQLAHTSARHVAGYRRGAVSIRFVGDLKAVRGWVAMGLTR